MVKCDSVSALMAASIYTAACSNPTDMHTTYIHTIRGRRSTCLQFKETMESKIGNTVETNLTVRCSNTQAYTRGTAYILSPPFYKQGWRMAEVAGCLAAVRSCLFSRSFGRLASNFL